MARGVPIMAMGWPIGVPVEARTRTTSRGTATVTHSSPRRSTTSVMPNPRVGPRWRSLPSTGTRSSVFVPVLATHTLPAATSRLTGRTPTGISRMT